MARKAFSRPSDSSTATNGFGAKLWLAATPPDIARHFDELIAPLMGKIKVNATDCRTLASLLPKLLRMAVQ